MAWPAPAKASKDPQQGGIEAKGGSWPRTRGIPGTATPDAQ
eukprot:CAMPEP_0206426842 /NCGR_PEP_ID=MMETSP0324_2-20121206/4646_1 /ASSEMBLY_ACC=CAM_ASM_000836 /TAXON_ID=2866 /ORGANISM="Crypthecodinium cohnii, Strain Seligo" /LENGTH=40 /DNA_ID= /DNA_START= /DNA_END= /DNA_ORIENTATION=